MDDSIFVSIRHLNAPWIAADFAILNEAAVNVWLDIDFHLLATKRTRDHEFVRHLRHHAAAIRAAAPRATVSSSRPATIFGTPNRVVASRRT
jgi:hypothetical protein